MNDEVGGRGGGGEVTVGSKKMKAGGTWGSQMNEASWRH